MSDDSNRGPFDPMDSASHASAFLSAIVDGALDGIIIIDEAGTIISFNPAAVTLFDYSQKEAVGRNVSLLMPEPYRSLHGAYLSEYLRTGRSKIIGVGRVVEGQRKDGSLFPMELGVTVVDVDSKRFFVGFIHDLSERRRFEALMHELHTNRLDLIEKMAIGLANEIKQPLTAINAYLNVAHKLLKENARPTKAIDRVLNDVNAQVLRMSETINNLRQFFGRGQPMKTLQSLNDVVQTACELTEVEARKHKVKMEVRLEAESDRVVIDKIQIQQVIVSLKRNAIEAMRGCPKREMTVSTRLVDPTMIRIDVADTRSEASKTIEKKPFDPFATADAEGLGVGLSLSRSIIKAHSGKLWAEHNPAGGLVFSFVLPLAEQ